MWHGHVLEILQGSGIFVDVALIGAKIRASFSETLFLDVHYDPTTGSYSYALIDLTSPYAGDKRILGWDDYPHEGVERIQRLCSYPHHIQTRDSRGAWLFEQSELRGDVERDMRVVLEAIRAYLSL